MCEFTSRFLNLPLFMRISFRFYHYSFVLKLEIRGGDISKDIIYCIKLLKLSHFFLYEVDYFSHKVFKELFWNFVGDWVKPLDCFW